MTAITCEDRARWRAANVNKLTPARAKIAEGSVRRLLDALDAADAMDGVLHNAETMATNGAFYGDNVDRWLTNVMMARAAYRALVAPPGPPPADGGARDA